MIVNGKTLLAASPLSGMIDHKARSHGVSYGLAEVGVDIRIRETLVFTPPNPLKFAEIIQRGSDMSEGRAWEAQAAFHGLVTVNGDPKLGRFALASAIEPFQMPQDLVAFVHDKSSWARNGVSVFNTVIEPGWRGYLTLELAFQGTRPIHIPAGTGIAQVIFSEISEQASYDGPYQDQPPIPVGSVSG